MNFEEKDITDILCVCPQLEVATVRKLLMKYCGDNNREAALECTLRDIFPEARNIGDLHECYSDVQVLHRLFPQLRKDVITEIVRTIGKVENRLSIACRFLLKKLPKKTKRKSSLADKNMEVGTKKGRFDEAENEGSEESNNNDIVPHEDNENVSENSDETVEENVENMDDSIFFDELPSFAVDESEDSDGIDLVSFVDFENPQPSTSKGVTCSVSTIIKNSNTSVKPSTILIDVTVRPSENGVGEDNATKEFDLVKHLKAVTGKSDAEVMSVCDSFGLNVEMRPPNDMLDRLVNTLSEDAPSIAEESSKIIEKSQEDPIDMKLYYRLLEIFPDASQEFIRSNCKNRNLTQIDAAINDILSVPDYPKRDKAKEEDDINYEERIEILKELLPDADENYLRQKCVQFANNQQMNAFIANAIERKDYPTEKEALRKSQLSAQAKQYTSDFNVKKFLEAIPDPVKYFNDPSRITRADMYASRYIIVYMKNRYDMLRVSDIVSLYSRYIGDSNLVAMCEELDRMKVDRSKRLKWKRKRYSLDTTVEPITNIPILQELAYISHKEEINNYLIESEEKLKREREEAKSLGLLTTCNCCYDEEVMQDETAICENKCTFCKSCVARGVEVAFGEGKLQFPCLSGCNGYFSIQTLQKVLNPKLFSRIAQKQQLEEIKAAGLEDLEQCPFCDFVSIPAPGDKLFKCLNPDCMKESCRECKEPSHLPLRCDEIERDDDVKKRRYIEDKMSEAMMRQCHSCGLKFIKVDGCNKMTCTCGAKMCYVCGKPVKDYKHFNGEGGDQFHLCPLFSKDTELHQMVALKAGDEAKKELGEGAEQLKIDPTADLAKYVKEPKKMKTQNHNLIPPQFLIPHRRHHHHHHHHHHHRHRRPL